MPDRRRRPHASQATPIASPRPAPTPRSEAREPRASRRGGFRFPSVGTWAAFLVGAWVMRLLDVLPTTMQNPIDLVLSVLTATVAAMGWRYAARERLARARAVRARGSAGTR